MAKFHYKNNKNIPSWKMEIPKMETNLRLFSCQNNNQLNYIGEKVRWTTHAYLTSSPMELY
jgi:hypothetical protein